MHLEDKKKSLIFFWSIFFMYMMVYMTKNCFSAAMASIVNEGVLTKSQTGLITAVFYIVYTPAQALLAAMAGASFVAPYVNRLDNILGDGTEVVESIVNQLQNYGSDCRVLAASFKNAEQVHRCANAGCHSVTVSASILKTIISHPMTENAIAGFERDWASVYGDKTIKDF